MQVKIQYFFGLATANSSSSVDRNDANIIGRIFTFCVSRRRRKMYCGHARLRVCVSVSVSVRGRTPTLLHGPGFNLGAW